MLISDVEIFVWGCLAWWMLVIYIYIYICVHIYIYLFLLHMIYIYIQYILYKYMYSWKYRIMEKPCASPLRYFRMLKQQMHFFLSLKGCGMAATLQATKVAGLPPAVILFLDFLSTSGVNFEILWLKDVESSSSSNMVNLRHPKTQKKTGHFWMPLFFQQWNTPSN